MGGYDPADWLIAAGIALGGMGLVAICLWRVLGAL